MVILFKGYFTMEKEALHSKKGAQVCELTLGTRENFVEMKSYLAENPNAEEESKTYRLT